VRHQDATSERIARPATTTPPTHSPTKATFCKNIRTVSRTIRPLCVKRVYIIVPVPLCPLHISSGAHFRDIKPFFDSLKNDVSLFATKPAEPRIIFEFLNLTALSN
jgi:hypothetical protein